MHRVAIPDDITERVIRHCDRAHVYDEFDPRRSALLVLDMQNAFMLPEVSHTLCPTAVYLSFGNTLSTDEIVSHLERNPSRG
jgi:hypothetical protein